MARYTWAAAAALAGAAAPVFGQVANELAPMGPAARPSRTVVPSSGGVIDALGDVKANYNVETFMAQNGCLGVEEAWGFFWVSARNLVAGAKHRIGKFSPTGTGIALYDQAPVYNATLSSATTSPWGGRDGAADEANNLLYFGHELGHISSYPYNPGTGALGAGTTVQIPGIATAIRALAYNPNNGHFYTADFTSTITEFTVNPPAVVTTHLNQAGPGGIPGALYGLAFDEVNGTFWGWSQNACGTGTGQMQMVYAAELNATTLAPTGRNFCGFLTGAVQNISGGADVYCGDPANPGKLSLVGLHQATPDIIIVYDIGDNCGASCYPDCNLDQVLNLGDFGCFQTKFALNDPYADCNQDQVLNLGDFGCFQTKFALGCP